MSSRPLSSRHAPIFISKRAAKAITAEQLKTVLRKNINHLDSGADSAAKQFGYSGALDMIDNVVDYVFGDIIYMHDWQSFTNPNGSLRRKADAYFEKRLFRYIDEAFNSLTPEQVAESLGGAAKAAELNSDEKIAVAGKLDRLGFFGVWLSRRLAARRFPRNILNGLAIFRPRAAMRVFGKYLSKREIEKWIKHILLLKFGNRWIKVAENVAAARKQLVSNRLSENERKKVLDLIDDIVAGKKSYPDGITDIGDILLVGLGRERSGPRLAVGSKSLFAAADKHERLIKESASVLSKYGLSGKNAEATARKYYQKIFGTLVPEEAGVIQTATNTVQDDFIKALGPVAAKTVGEKQGIIKGVLRWTAKWALILEFITGAIGLLLVGKWTGFPSSVAGEAITNMFEEEEESGVAGASPSVRPQRQETSVADSKKAIEQEFFEVQQIIMSTIVRAKMFRTKINKGYIDSVIDTANLPDNVKIELKNKFHKVIDTHNTKIR